MLDSTLLMTLKYFETTFCPENDKILQYICAIVVVIIAICYLNNEYDKFNLVASNRLCDIKVFYCTLVVCIFYFFSIIFSQKLTVLLKKLFLFYWQFSLQKGLIKYIHLIVLTIFKVLEALLSLSKFKLILLASCTTFQYTYQMFIVKN